MGSGLLAPDGGNAGHDPQRLLRALLQGHGEEARGDHAAGHPELAELHPG